MRFPNRNIFWECIASPYLELKDMAIVEASIENHAERMSLQLPSPPSYIYKTKSPSKSMYPLSCNLFPNPYSSLLMLTENRIDLISDEMKTWCERRKLKLNDINLRYSMKLSRYPIRSSRVLSTNVDVLNHIKSLSIEDPNITNFDILCNRLHSIERLTHYTPSDTDIYALIKLVSMKKYYSKTSIRDLDSLTLCLTMISSRTITSLLNSIPNIRSITFMDTEGILSDSHIIELAKLATNLSSICLTSSTITDRGMEEFRRQTQQFVSVKLDYCPNITISGIQMMLDKSKDTLKELRLRYDHQEHSLHENDIIPILSTCSNIEYLNVEPIMYSDSILHTVGSHCHGLKQLKLVSNHLDLIHHNFSLQGIESLCSGCKSIESISIIGFGYSPTIIQRLGQTYKNTLKSINLLVFDSESFERFETEFIHSTKKVIISGLYFSDKVKQFTKILHDGNPIELLDYSVKEEL